RCAHPRCTLFPYTTLFRSAEFLKYARPMEIPEDRVELEEVVQRAIAEVAQTMPQVTIEWAGNFDGVAGDEGLLRQALLNLTRNRSEEHTSELQSHLNLVCR